MTLTPTTTQVEVAHGSPVPLGYATVEVGSVASLDGLMVPQDYSVNYGNATVTFSSRVTRSHALFSLRADIPPVITFSQDMAIDGRVRTTDATPTEVYRLTLLPLTGYTGTYVVIGVDTGNGAVHIRRQSFGVKRLNAGALAVGAAELICPPHVDPAASTWQVTPSVSGNDAVLTVAGAAGRTIDWSLSGLMTSFTPAGR